jgi:hypothetical protein
MRAKNTHSVFFLSFQPLDVFAKFPPMQQAQNSFHAK